MKELLCITCPNGCCLRVEERPDGISVTGNLCRRGVDFAVAELTAPRRTVTTTVRTAFPETPVLPVRTAGEIPKDRVFDLMRLLALVRVTEHVRTGDAVVKDALGLGVDVIATGRT
jgi:CxxC motif-containing protein